MALGAELGIWVCRTGRDCKFCNGHGRHSTLRSVLAIASGVAGLGSLLRLA